MTTQGRSRGNLHHWEGSEHKDVAQLVSPRCAQQTRTASRSWSGFSSSATRCVPSMDNASPSRADSAEPNLPHLLAHSGGVGGEARPSSRVGAGLDALKTPSHQPDSSLRGHRGRQSCMSSATVQMKPRG